MQSRVVAVIIVITLALGIGAITAVFSVVYAVLVRPLTAPEPSRLVMLWMTNPSLGYQEFYASLSDLRDVREQAALLEDLSPHAFGSVNLTNIRPAEALFCAWVSPRLPALLGAKVVAGRLFVEGDGRVGRDHVAILSYQLWQRRFGRDPAVIGKSLTLNREIYTVVGVASLDFEGPVRFDIGGAVGLGRIDVWVPLAWEKRDIGGQNLVPRENRVFQCLARLKARATMDAAAAELTAIGSTLASQYPDTNRGWSLALEPLYAQIVRDSKVPLLLILLAVAAFLLIACANISSLLLAQGVARERELAIRVALGAAPARILRLLLTESTLFAVFGGLAGLLLAYFAVAALPRLIPTTIPRINTARINVPVVLFAIGMCGCSALIFGLVPSLQVYRADVMPLIHSGRRIMKVSKQSVFGLLITVELALATPLLISATLFLLSFSRLIHTGPGFQPGQAFSALYYLPSFAYPDADQQVRFVKRLMSKMVSTPGIESAAAIDLLPFSGDEYRTTFLVEGQTKASSHERREANYRRVSENYFKTLGVPLRQGRGFTVRDDRSAKPVAVVNETMVRQYFAGHNPIGARIRTSVSGGPPGWREIVGVVGDIKYMKLNEPMMPDIFVPLAQEPSDTFSIVVRSRLSERGVQSVYQQSTQSLDPDEPLSEVTTLEELLGGSIANERFYTTIATAFAAAAFLLAIFGVAGVTWFAAKQRAFEIAVRGALGASRRSILLLMMRSTILRASAGVVIGTGLGLNVNRVISNIVLPVTSHESIAITLTVPIVLLSVCTVTALGAVSRQADVEPSSVLRAP